MRPYATNQKKGADLMFGRMLIGLKTYFEVFNMAVDDFDFVFINSY